MFKLVREDSHQVGHHASKMHKHSQPTESNKAINVSFIVMSNRVFCPRLPVCIPLFGHQLQEFGMTRIEGEGRVNIDPLDLSCVIASLQRQLAHTVACSNNKDISLP